MCSVRRERQRDMRTLRQKLELYREAMAKGLFADLFAFCARLAHPTPHTLPRSMAHPDVVCVRERATRACSNAQARP